MGQRDCELARTSRPAFPCINWEGAPSGRCPRHCPPSTHCGHSEVASKVAQSTKLRHFACSGSCRRMASREAPMKATMLIFPFALCAAHTAVAQEAQAATKEEKQICRTQRMTGSLTRVHK